MRILRKTVKKSFLKSRWALVSTGVSLSIRTVMSSYKLIKLGKHTFLLVKPCWLFSFSTWVWKWITGLAIPSPYQGSRWLAFSSWSHFLVALLEDMSDVYFPPVSGNVFLLHSWNDPSKIVKSDITMTPASSFNVCEYTLSGSMDLEIFSWFMYSLIWTWLFSKKSPSSWFQPFLWSLGTEIPESQSG